jgi:hypothetical protein
MGVIIGMDPHKSSATIEVVDERGRVLAAGRYATDKTGYAAMLAAGRRYHDRTWAVEGCNGIGRHIAHRLVHDGETVLDVRAKLSAQVRVFATGNGRKSDPVGCPLGGDGRATHPPPRADPVGCGPAGDGHAR